MSQYLAEEEKIEDVIKKDKEILKNAGVTFEQIADALDQIFKCFNFKKEEQRTEEINKWYDSFGGDWEKIEKEVEKKPEMRNYEKIGLNNYPTGFQKIAKTLSIYCKRYKGWEECQLCQKGKVDWPGEGATSVDFYIRGLPNGNKIGRAKEEPTLVSGLIPHLIKTHHFFEGTVAYGIKPEWAIKLLEIVEKEKPNPNRPKSL